MYKINNSSEYFRGEGGVGGGELNFRGGGGGGNPRAPTF